MSLVRCRIAKISLHPNPPHRHRPRIGVPMRPALGLSSTNYPLLLGLAVLLLPYLWSLVLLPFKLRGNFRSEGKSAAPTIQSPVAEGETLTATTERGNRDGFTIWRGLKGIIGPRWEDAPLTRETRTKEITKTKSVTRTTRVTQTKEVTKTKSVTETTRVTQTKEVTKTKSVTQTTRVTQTKSVTKTTLQTQVTSVTQTKVQIQKKVEKQTTVSTRTIVHTRTTVERLTTVETLKTSVTDTQLAKETEPVQVVARKFVEKPSVEEVSSNDSAVEQDPVALERIRTMGWHQVFDPRRPLIQTTFTLSSRSRGCYLITVTPYPTL
jgi:hypothetical protein